MARNKKRKINKKVRYVSKHVDQITIHRIDGSLIMIGDIFECIKEFKVSWLPGGFRLGFSYKVFNIRHDEILMSDDEENDWDAMNLSIDDFEKYFGIKLILKNK